MRVKLAARLVFALLMCVFWPVVGFCVAFEVPQKFWTEFYPLRWVVIGAMIAYLPWLLPQVSQILAKQRKRREASR